MRKTYKHMNKLKLDREPHTKMNSYPPQCYRIRERNESANNEILCGKDIVEEQKTDQIVKGQVAEKGLLK